MTNMKVVGGNLNVRRKPDINSEIINVLTDGDVIKTGPEENGWRQCGSGYVMARWLEPAEDAASDQAKETEQIVAAAEEIKDAAKEIKDAAKTVKKKAESKKTQGNKK